MRGLMTTVTNERDHKRYFVSSVKTPNSEELYQSAVFKKIIGPFANFPQPQATFFGNDAAYLHERVTDLMHNVEPSDWSGEKFSITAEGDEADATIRAMITKLRGEST